MDKEDKLRHIAIIMDGNGRWARSRGLARSEGHRRGLAAFKEAVGACLELGVRFLTVYAFSTENWRRSKEEVDFLMTLCETVITRELPFMIKNDIRLRHLGRKAGLSDSLKGCIKRAEDLTKNNHNLSLQLAFNYGGRLELVDAVRCIALGVKEGRLSVDEVSPEVIAASLYTAGIPDPDLLIRTSGEMRVSNFLLWQIAYSELYVTKKYWPDFHKKDLQAAIAEYRKRRRRFGGADD